ncbi:CoA transferase, partial [Paraburkholderia sp. UYCP14C]|uniref:CaiB/BaiF CoA transferase family protein n=1 Tax=Paraburkholderia sp. UYCP14C TaxID=2511130 RepID=UPI0010213759
MNSERTTALAGIRVLDLSRILAGPSATQLLGDLGADIVKVEKPDEGDDTRKWGPPYVRGTSGEETEESAYYLAANRNKRAIAIDIGSDAGRQLVHQLIAHADVLVENYKVGGLARYGLAYEQIKDRYPRLVYCSITGFGQTGPYASRPGYDFLIQGMGGIMSLTGVPDGEPMKAGVGIADVMTGMYAAVGILAAPQHRERTGKGQHIDISLLDTQISWLVNAGTNYLADRQLPTRLGNGHPNIVPYQVFSTADAP